MTTPTEYLHYLESVRDEQDANIDLLVSEAKEMAATIDAVKAVAKTMAARVTEYDLLTKRNQGAGDMVWADLCATRRTWRDAVAMLDGIDGL